MAREKVYTRAGDDGTTGLFYGGRVGKDSALPRAYGAVDEAQAILGLARAEAGKGTELDDMLVHICRDLWVLMAELATLPENRHKLVDEKHVSPN
jgi:cob(I)alamin adenosyltransferase